MQLKSLFQTNESQNAKKNLKPIFNRKSIAAYV